MIGIPREPLHIFRFRVPFRQKTEVHGECLVVLEVETSGFDAIDVCDARVNLEDNVVRSDTDVVHQAWIRCFEPTFLQFLAILREKIICDVRGCFSLSLVSPSDELAGFRIWLGMSGESGGCD